VTARRPDSQLGLRFSPRMMLVTPSTSDRTIMPNTIVANHMKVASCENAGRSDWSALQRDSQSER
jgi:hypothetical protein